MSMAVFPFNSVIEVLRIEYILHGVIIGVVAHTSSVLVMYTYAAIIFPTSFSFDV